MSSEIRPAYTTDPKGDGRPRAGLDPYEATSLRVYSFDRNDGSVVLDLQHKGTMLGEIVLTKDEIEMVVNALRRESRDS